MKISRRKFLGQASCAAIGSTTMMSSIANLMLANKMIGGSLTPVGNDYKALVCVLLAGGNDSYNMLLPKGDSETAPEYLEYAATRADLALPQPSILPIDTITPTGRLMGIHPSMGELKTMFDNEQAAFVANIGTLIEPIANEQEFYSGLKNIPLGIYSHSDQIQQWQTATPQSREAIGWGGRMADILKAENTNQGISMNISLDGRNVFQAGQTVLEYSISNNGNGVQGIQPLPSWYSNSGMLNTLRDDMIKDMATQMYSNVFKGTLGDLTNQSLESLEQFQTAISNVPPFMTNFSQTGLSQDLQMMARTIAAKDELGMCRQTFFTTFGGWDHHDEVINNQNFMLGVVSDAISQFFSALAEVGMEDKVTLFTISDFARTLTSNGNGSDHAWGGNSIIAGGAVKGKELYGTFPDLYLNGNPLVVSDRGNLIPTTAADLYFAELALWFGVQPSDLHLILPNITNFYSPGGGTPPMGFLL